MYSLGNYGERSFHGGAWGIEEMVGAGVAGGYGVMGMSDEGGFWGGVEFSQACGRAGVKGVLGCRLRVRGLGMGEVQLVARDRKGYGSISRLVGQAVGGEVDMAGLEEMQGHGASGIWVSVPMSVGLGGNGRTGAYQRWMGAWEGLLERGWENLWVELGWINERERLLQRRLYGELSRRGWRRWVVQTRARHAGGAGAAALLEVLQSIGTLTRVGQVHPDKLESGDYGLMSAAALQRRFARVPEVWESTQAYVEACEFDYPYGRLFLPCPGGVNGEAALDERGRQRALKWRCLRGIVRRYGRGYPWQPHPGRAAIVERLRAELAIVGETGYAGYFLIFAELVEECARREIPVLARGSAAGSLICHALGVSNVCPFRFGLCFERFLNVDRLRHSKLPDIDLDLPWDRRDEMMEWVRQRYGENHVAMIGGFAHFKGRAAVAEVAKAMGIPAHQAHAWSKRLPYGSLARFLRDREGYRETDAAFADPRFVDALELALGLNGLPRHPMMHPCGIVVSDRDLRDFTPLVLSAKGFPMSQMAMEPIEDLGLLKLDLLGQAGLSVLRDCIANLRATGVIDADALPLEGIDHADARIFAMVRSGGARGVFHIESPAMTGLLRLCRCADLDCMVATVSVIRPGAANEDKKTRFALRYLGLEEPQYVHPVLEDVLGETFGLMVYEEHILLVAHRFAGMDLGTADRLRRILIKKADDEAIEELGVMFAASARRIGRTESEIESVWRELRAFSGFMFNKAHGAAYAIEAYHACWLKFHWPVPFLAAVLNNRRGFYHPLVYVLELLRQGAGLSLPDVQRFPDRYWADGQQVALPLWQIDGLGELFLERWARARSTGMFRGWRDFQARVAPTRAEAEALAAVGALRAFFPNRHEAAWHAAQCAASSRRACNGRHPELFADGAPPLNQEFRPMPDQDCAAAEASRLGFPVTLNPFQLWLDADLCNGTIPIAQRDRYSGREIEIAGLIVCHRLHKTLHGDWMKFLTLADPSGMAELVLFPEAYQEFGAAISTQHVARLRVAVPDDDRPNDGVLTVVTTKRSS